MVHRVPFTKLIHHPTEPSLVLANGAEFLVVNTNDGKMTKEYPKESETKPTSQELHRNIDFSQDGSRLVTTGDDKNIRVYDTTDQWKQLFSRPANKRVNALQFTKDASTIVVADKFGDVHCHPAEAATEDKLAPIVGHVSMLTDVILSDDEKYVITADRDEHIRVSRFPNGYNIENYCLGHTDVVTVIRLLPWNVNMMVSAGGDNTIRTWDFVKGAQIQSLNYLDYIKQYVNTPANENSHTEDPIVSSIKFDKTSKTVAVAFTKVSAILLLEWKDDEKSLVYKDVIHCDRPVLDISFDLQGKLWTSLAPTTESDALLVIYSPVNEKVVG
ncbi:WD40-repeat-containing domain protein [Halteromyces radiatus]|uniref:WD40-repeat-containing domain protein n=1 Tax=Halteromyces radiatus TaxID=101107 RepID=UPI0022211064|nr:WD40-repeat-containing domain protein [Halteromyces radiatus]KAI8083128.1 WD40-repeat-containing domain protein [Halteromyces radiatus]